MPIVHALDIAAFICMIFGQEEGKQELHMNVQIQDEWQILFFKNGYSILQTA